MSQLITAQSYLPLNNKNQVLSRPHCKHDFLGIIVSAATFAPPGSEVDTSLRCRRRPERKQCHGLIHLRLQETPPKLAWWCPSCGDSGIITSWKGAPWKRIHTNQISANKDNAGKFFEIILSEKEFSLLSEIKILNPNTSALVKRAIKTTLGTFLVGTANVFDDLMRYLAFEINHEQKSKRHHSLNMLFDKVHHVITRSM